MYSNADEYYSKIIKVVENLLDGQWEEIVIRICKDDFHSSTGVYLKNNNEYKYIGDYLETDQIDFDEFDVITESLSNIANMMQKELREKEQKLWTSFIFTLKVNGEYEPEYSYDELGENEFKDTVNWRYKRLGISPNEKNMKYLDRD